MVVVILVVVVCGSGDTCSGSINGRTRLPYTSMHIIVMSVVKLVKA